ncbi:MAG: IS66 family insertion sequence element accessory protein TnpB, partial [Alphaproteobacteria bacterium]|nr:IS66 family insertion sequence element accessory protein TnpB [Alphaproteobacteria bacterium]
MLYDAPKILLAAQPIDMRKSYQGLGALVEQVLRQDPFSGYQFVFY